jgi:hypothetical protein
MNEEARPMAMITDAGGGVGRSAASALALLRVPRGAAS